MGKLQCENALIWRGKKINPKKVESSGDFKVNPSLQNCIFLKSHTITPNTNFSGTWKFKREVPEIP